MEDLYFTLTGSLAAWVEAGTGVPVAPESFRLPRAGGQLSLGAFVTGDAVAAAQKLTDALGDCPEVRAVRERNGWLLFWLSDEWFDGLIAWARALDTRPGGSYVENRMASSPARGMRPVRTRRTCGRPCGARTLPTVGASGGRRTNGWSSP